MEARVTLCERQCGCPAAKMSHTNRDTQMGSMASRGATPKKDASCASRVACTIQCPTCIALLACSCGTITTASSDCGCVGEEKTWDTHSAPVGPGHEMCSLSAHDSLPSMCDAHTCALAGHRSTT